MAATPSTMMPLGTTAPDFTLRDTVTDHQVGLRDSAAPATIVAFICNHCPYVLHIIEGFVQFAKDVQKQGVRVIAISSNDATQYPQDGPERMALFAREHGFTFPYLYDGSQDVAKAYAAACTPDLYLFDSDLTCVYRGRFDAATPGNAEPVNGADLRAAVDAVLAGDPVSDEQIPSIGCNIKWK